MDTKKNDNSNFRRLLAEEIKWPHIYMFKFIVETKLGKEDQIISLFPKSAKVSFRPSRTGKYTSISISVIMGSPDEVLKHYEEAAKIPGIMSL